MTVDWLLAAVYVGGFGAFLVATVWLVRRSERRLDGGQDPTATPGAAQSGSGDPVSAYLDRMSGELLLPAADIAEVRAELADHLQDSIASLEAEGLDRERATREALARLGSADELGRHLRHAHQSTRRLLAGAGGGVFAAGGGFVLGYLGGLAVALLLALVIAAIMAALTRIGLPMPDLMGDHGDTVNSLLLGFAMALGAGVGIRYAVRTSAGLSRRAPRSIAVFWAVAGALGFGWFSIFGVHGPQSWPGVAVALCIPAVVVWAAFVRIEQTMPHVGRWAVVVVLVSVVGSSLMFGAVAVAPVSSSTPVLTEIGLEPPDMHFDTVAPMAPAAWLPAGYPSGSGWEQLASGETHVSFDGLGSNPPTPTTTALANWTDVRFEAWRALPGNDDPASDGVDPQYSSPLAIQPANFHDNSLDATFHFERMRDSKFWWVFLTGIGPDGHRYRLADGGGGGSSFNGSVWDWLTAPQ
jgi:hypothetical protein